MTQTKLRSIQEEIRPVLTRVDDRKLELRTLQEAVQKFEAGTALALLGPPGVDLRRISSDIIRGIPEQTLVVWLDLAVLTRRLPQGLPDDLTVLGGPWDQLLDQNLISAFEAACKTEGVQADPLEVEEDSEDVAVARIQRFANVSRQKIKRAPVMVIENMHRMPWKVSERFQHTLRKALDNGERRQLLRLLLTSASDFLSGDAIGNEGEDFGTSPLYFRTQRFTVQPYKEELLWELSPLPGGLPDALIKTLINLTGGSIGLMELFYRMISQEPELGRSLHEAIGKEQNFTDDAWFWSLLSRLEPVSHPARQLVREGLGALLSCPKGRSTVVLAALAEFLAGRSRDETTTEALLPLELAGLVTTTPSNSGWYHYQFTTPLVANLLRAILPEGRNLREQLELFGRDYHWDEPPPELQALPSQLSQDTGVRGTTGGKNLHVVAQPVGPTDGPQIRGPIGVRTTVTNGGAAIGITSPDTRPTTTGPSGPRNSTPTGVPGTDIADEGPRATDIPEVVRILRRDTSPESARLLLQLVRKVALATQHARNEGNTAFLTPANLELNWLTRSVTTGGLEPGDQHLDARNLTAEALIRLQPEWEVSFKPTGEPLEHSVEAVALFLPPENLARWLQARQSSKTLSPQNSDDVYALGLIIGLLLALEPNPQLVIERLESRLANARHLAVGPLVRLVKRCLDPIPGRRPSLNDVIQGIDRVLADPYAVYRSIARVLFYASMIAVVVLGLVDFVFDTRVDNQILLYTGVKVAGAAGAAAFYGLAFVIFGRTEKEQVLKQLVDFLRQRMNRVRWMAFPAFMAVVFSAFFAHRLYNNWGVTLSMNSDQKLEEIKERLRGSDRCDYVWRPTSPVSSATVRLDLNNRDYIFIVDEIQDVTKRTIRREYLWTADQVAAQRQRRWGETLTLYALPQPSADKSCLPVPLTPNPSGSMASPPAGTGTGSGAGATGTGSGAATNPAGSPNPAGGASPGSNPSASGTGAASVSSPP